MLQKPKTRQCELRPWRRAAGGPIQAQFPRHVEGSEVPKEGRREGASVILFHKK